MTEQEFETKFDSGELYEQYSQYIMDHCAGDRPIGNGTMLITALEDGYLYNDFKDSLVMLSEE